MKLKISALLTLIMFGLNASVWADDATMAQLLKSNEELVKVVSDLTGKVENLEGRLAKAERSSSISIPASSGETTGGVMRTPGGDINMDGFVDVGYNHNFATPTTPTGGNNATGNTTLRAFDRENDTIDLNAVQINMYRPAPEAGGVGFRTEFTYGTDAQVIESAGFLGGTDEFSIQEAFAEIKIPFGSGITVWAGKYSTLIGAEVIENHLNWNASRSFLFTLAEPATHTGARAMYSWLDGKVLTTVGIVNGWDLAIDNNKAKDIEAQLKWVPSENFNIAQNFIGGSQVVDDMGDNRYLFDTVATWIPLPKDLPKLSLMANFDYGTEERLGKTSPAREGGPAEWSGYALYGRYQVTDKLALGARWEQFWDDQGVRTGTAAIAELIGMTFTADYKIYENMLSRLEYRHDQSDSNTNFDGGTDNSQDTVGASLIYMFG